MAVVLSSDGWGYGCGPWCYLVTVVVWVVAVVLSSDG